jgi:hypothetical protein
MRDGEKSSTGGEGPALAPPRPSAKPGTGTQRAKVASMKPATRDPLAVTATDADGAAPVKPTARKPAAVVQAPKPASKAAPSDAPSGSDDADTVASLPGHVRASLADIAGRAAFAASPVPPASARPAASAPPPPSSRASVPPSAPSSRPSSAPSPNAIIRNVAGIRPTASVPPAPPSSQRAPIAPSPPSQPRPSPASQRPHRPSFGPAPSGAVAFHAAPLPRPSTPQAFARSSVEVLQAAPVAPMVPMVPSPPATANVAYERAFRAWSSPKLEAPAHDTAVPLTYQVYTPSELTAPRTVSLSRIAEESAFALPRPNLAARVAMVVAALLTVFVTTAVITFGVSDESPARAAQSLPSRAGKVASALGPGLPATATPTTTALDLATLSAPTVLVVEAAAVTKPAIATPIASAVSPAKPKAAAPKAAVRPAAHAADTWAAPAVAPASLRGAAPPPNPYGGTPPSAKR